MMRKKHPLEGSAPIYTHSSYLNALMMVYWLISEEDKSLERTEVSRSLVPFLNLPRLVLILSPNIR